MKIPARFLPDNFQLWLYAVILCAYCLYQLHWAPNKSLSELELSECYTQIYVNGRMVGSGFFLEDVKGWHRNYYQHPLLNVMMLAGWLYILLPHPKRPDQTPNAATNASAADGPPSEGR